MSLVQAKDFEQGLACRTFGEKNDSHYFKQQIQYSKPYFQIQ